MQFQIWKLENSIKSSEQQQNKLNNKVIKNKSVWLKGKQIKKYNDSEE